MKANKMVVAALSLALSLSMVACNKKENTPANGDKTTTEQNTADTTNNANNDYVEKYSRFYGDTLGNLGNYRMYETPEATTEYYKTNQYPGNEKYVEELNMNPKLIDRNLNVGFSGGEKKKNEILQMLVLNPKLSILDETDSGLDVDAIRTVSKGIEMYKSSENAVLIITHNMRILENLKVDFVHILVDGKIVKTGNADLAKEIEQEGYEKYKKVEV